MKTIILTISLILVACGRPAAASDTPSAPTCAPTAQPADDDHEAARPPNRAPNQESLQRVIARGGTVFDQLSEEAKTEILDSARWTPGGIATFRATRARTELSEEAFNELLAVFGLMRHDAIENAKCIGRATCRTSQGDWCVIKHCTMEIPR